MKVLECSQHKTFIIFKRSRAAYSVVADEIWQKLILIHAFIVVLVTCMNDEDSSKTESTRLLTTFLPLYYGDFFSRSSAANCVNPCRILLNFEPIQAFIAVLVTSKNE